MGLREKYEAKKKENFRVCKELAEQGNADAQFKLSVMYYHGKGTEANEEAAFRWLKAAAEGNAGTGLDYKYDEEYGGNRVPESQQWILAAAKNGNANADFFVSKLNADR
ncbi:MAG: SEL1-like repeat protein, partial [Oscillospiraceae bacterium]|nr:SEL1-like repeat protein [Oscillospiraceae bacterium]